MDDLLIEFWNFCSHNRNNEGDMLWYRFQAESVAIAANWNKSSFYSTISTVEERFRFMKCTAYRNLLNRIKSHTGKILRFWNECFQYQQKSTKIPILHTVAQWNGICGFVLWWNCCEQSIKFGFTINRAVFTEWFLTVVRHKK